MTKKPNTKLRLKHLHKLNGRFKRNLHENGYYQMRHSFAMNLCFSFISALSAKGYKYVSIGGQAVIEGVMMRGPGHQAIAVRTPSGRIEVVEKPLTPPEKRIRLVRLPFVRGVISLIESMFTGVQAITESAKFAMEDAEEAQKEKSKKEERGENAVLFGTVIVSLALGVGLFFVLPTLLSNLFGLSSLARWQQNLIEGGIRLAIFLIYLVSVSAMKDIRRVFAYHGAEHKTIACYEKGLPLTPDNASGCSRLHPRCGTSFLLIFIVVSILVFALVNYSQDLWVKVGLRLALLPVVAGVSYEVLKLLAKFDNAFTRALRWPGMMLQRLTTREPDHAMLEVAITAFERCLDDPAESL